MSEHATPARPSTSTTAPPAVAQPGPEAAPGARARRPRARRLASAAWPVAASLAVFLVIWQAIVAIGDYPPFILPGPLVVAQRFAVAWTDGTMWPHFSST
ncbi:MAG TPA: hypothetical protein VFY23_10930, partial [Candidatus Limnocylindrales bacterium]|nr:hypothetical protein [Candidatus Limnocylindrales bacterium]